MAQWNDMSLWLLEHYGGAMLRVAGVGPLASWRPGPTTLTSPPRQTDGLLWARLFQETMERLFLVEIGTFAERRLAEQLWSGALRVLLDRGVLPNAVGLVLRPKGNIEVGASLSMESDLQWTKLGMEWRISKLWELPAAGLLASADPGAAPWAVLADLGADEERVLHDCRAVINQVRNEEERTNLLAATQVLMGLRFDSGNDAQYFGIMGGERVMNDSPVLQRLLTAAEIRGEARGEVRGEARGEVRGLLAVLRGRFGSVPEDLQQQIRAMTDADQLEMLLGAAGVVPDLGAFRARLYE